MNYKRQMIAPSMTAFLVRAMARKPEAIWPFEQFMRVLINNPKVLEDSESYMIKFPGGKFNWQGVINAVCNHLADDNPEWFGLTEENKWAIRAWFSNVWFRDFGVNIAPISQPRLWQVTQARNRVIREFKKSKHWENIKADLGFPPHYFKIAEKKER